MRAPTFGIRISGIVKISRYFLLKRSASRVLIPGVVFGLHQLELYQRCKVEYLQPLMVDKLIDQQKRILYQRFIFILSHTLDSPNN